MWSSTRVNLSSVFANNKGSDQPCSLVSASVIHHIKTCYKQNFAILTVSAYCDNTRFATLLLLQANYTIGVLELHEIWALSLEKTCLPGL